MDYGLLFRKLQNHNVQYLVCGGLAVNLHGVPRMTADIDIILNLTSENIQRFEECTNELNYKLSVPVKLSNISSDNFRKELRETKNLIALSFFNYDKDFLALDVLLDFPIAFQELWDKRKERKEGDTIVNVVSIEHLIQLKEYAARVQDKQDIYYLSKIKNEDK
jgi:hypothetical protein